MSAPAWTYPTVKKSDVVDNYHGIPVPDPFRNLEDLSAPHTQQWLQAQQQLCAAFIENAKERPSIKKRLAALNDHPKWSTPIQREDRLFYLYNEGLQDQPVLWAKTPKGEKQVLDPNALSQDGTVSLTRFVPSPDGRLLAYGTSASGSDWQEIRILNVDSGKAYPEVLRWCKFASIAWKQDRSGFYYNRFPHPDSVCPEDQANHSKVYWHQLGTDQQADRLVYERPDAKELTFLPHLSEDQAYLILHVIHGTDPHNRIFVRKADGQGDFTKLFDRGDAKYHFIANDGHTFYFLTDLHAPKGRLVSIAFDGTTEPELQEVLPEQDCVIKAVTILGDDFVIAFEHDAQQSLKRLERTTGTLHEITPKGMGTVVDLRADRKRQVCYFGFETFLQPMSIYRYDLKANALRCWGEAKLGSKTHDVEVTQVFYLSKDGTKVPLSLIHRKGIALDGSHPTLLYGYGGFNQSLTPAFSALRLAWVAWGGVFAVANLRGGSEYGESWHRAGMLESKQTVFDDFIAAAEWLIDNGYTQPRRLAIWGRSNGGLLVSACMVQRPELFGAVVCGVPVADMLRYHKFTVGRFWVPEYGNAEADPEHFKFIYAYSPLHNVRAGVHYPPTLIYTAASDDRVVPWHGMKLAAALQAANGGHNPIVLRFEPKAGHGHGKPTSKVIDEQVDILVFLQRTLLTNTKEGGR